MKEYIKLKKIYDLTADQKVITDYKAERRLILRNKYLKEIHNPNSMQKGHIFDEQLHQHYMTIPKMEKCFKPNIKNLIWCFTMTITCATLLASYLKKYRDEKEYRLRSGQVSYRDRDIKFV
ncbi:PREDICTED: uncharacterized protein LOC105365877 [Ceratosolen solmsi marchali]|uniref:NADH dehydrogenase [ubiquinone] 1 beta subcomplex subunit 4 n=1 Tax=Ceratosolen solmsi marchali TaxID=326594 RepID=A0AAJ6YQN4_9HYME|nr:PREDICTED: uncharacterized protein LOC105365877 [Ceratosolen solmsi marchali]